MSQALDHFANMCLSMSSTIPSLFLTFFLLLSSANAFNITKILFQQPDFSTFNNYLTQTQLASEINSRQTITVFVVENGAMSSLSGKPMDVIKKVLSLHVVLDYYDVQKLQQLPNKTTMLTTLFQSSGQASGKLGFLNVTAANTGGVTIASAAGSGVGASVVKAVVSQPYNISVVQISSAIMPSAIISSSPPSSSPTPHTSPAKPPSAAPPKASKAPTASPPKSGKAPTPSEAHPKATAPSASAPTDANAPAADAPTDANAPAADAPATTADSPAGSPPQGAANGPTADGPAGDAADAPKGSTAANSGISFVVVMTILCSTLFVGSIM